MILSSVNSNKKKEELDYSFVKSKFGDRYSKLYLHARNLPKGKYLLCGLIDY